jgi:hypothetical protein
MKNGTDIWMECCAMAQWTDASAWDSYLRSVEHLFGDRLAKLDANDPARRKANAPLGEGKFVVDFGPKDDSRWLLGKFERTRIELQIRHYKNGRDSFGRLRDNSITFHIPEKAHREIGADKLVEIFRMTTERWKAFYAFADLREIYCSKKASPPSIGALNVSSELPGVFWLTYFGRHYVAFIGRERLDALEHASNGPAGGRTLRLAESAMDVPNGLRAMLEHSLGTESFAGTGEVTIEKPEGKYALTLEQLSADAVPLGFH